MLYAGSPFYHSVLDGRLASAVGPGLTRVIARKSTSFSVFTSAVGGDASLDVNVQGSLIRVYISYTTCHKTTEITSAV